jgi:hypothetical protein
MSQPLIITGSEVWDWTPGDLLTLPPTRRSYGRSELFTNGQEALVVMYVSDLLDHSPIEVFNPANGLWARVKVREVELPGTIVTLCVDVRDAATWTVHPSRLRVVYRAKSWHSRRTE